MRTDITSAKAESEPLKKATTLHSFSELSDLLPDQVSTRTYKDRFNNTYDLVALMMYLLGIEERHFASHDPDLMKVFHQYEEDPRARTMWNLCMVRSLWKGTFQSSGGSFTTGI